MAGGQLLNALEHRERGGHTQLAEISIERLKVQIPFDIRIVKNSLDLRAEHKPFFRDNGIEQRLLAQTITGEQEGLRTFVPKRDSKHAT